MITFEIFSESSINNLQARVTQRAEQVAALKLGYSPAIPSSRDVFDATNQVITDDLINRSHETGVPIELPRVSQHETLEGRQHAQAQVDLLLRRAITIVEQDGRVHDVSEAYIRPFEGISEVVQWHPSKGQVRELNFSWIKLGF